MFILACSNLLSDKSLFSNPEQSSEIGDSQRRQKSWVTEIERSTACGVLRRNKRWRNNILWRFSACRNELQSVWIRDGAVVTRSSDLQEPNKPKPRLKSLDHVAIYDTRSLSFTYSTVCSFFRYEMRKVSQQVIKQNLNQLYCTRWLILHRYSLIRIAHVMEIKW
jgi:hypothetical protein